MYTYRQDFWIQLLLNLSRAIDQRVSRTGHHSEQVAQWVRCTGRKLGCNDADIQVSYWAALLHDIGKIGVPYRVLSKAGPLTRNEWRLMKLHPTIGSNIVETLDAIAPIAPIISAHQEKYDGSGYPFGLCGSDIPVGARILALADAYDAITNDRYYQRARSHGEAVVELKRNGGTHFDPEILDVFLTTVDPYWSRHISQVKVC
jgi:HD-GYP domain-containing protein (c-di-GMP phosphodiesterase class II)